MRTCAPFAGKMSNIRAVRKRQQLNNLVATVTELARPGYTVVDFCSGTVRVFIRDQSGHACIFITTPDHDCIRLLLHQQSVLCFSFLFKCLFFFFSLCTKTDNVITPMKMHVRSSSVALLKGQYLVGQDSCSHNSIDTLFDVCCFPLVHLPLSLYFLQGHVGIVLAHTLPDCQVCICKDFFFFFWLDKINIFQTLLWTLLTGMCNYF